MESLAAGGRERGGGGGGPVAVLDPVAGHRAAAGDRDEELPVPVPVAPAHRAQAQRRLVVSHGARLPRRPSAAGHPCRRGGVAIAAVGRGCRLGTAAGARDFFYFSISIRFFFSAVF